jgi:adenylate kinase family enzyme
MRRIAIVGPGGSGKSVLARRLGERLGLPVIHMDAHYWNAGWVATPRDVWDRKVHEMAAEDRWIIDGNYGRTTHIRFAAADAIIFLDFPRRIFIPRVLRRGLTYRGQTRPDMAEGCRERVTLEFLGFLWGYPRRSRPRILASMREAGAHARHEILRSPREVERFLASLPEQA